MYCYMQPTRILEIWQSNAKIGIVQLYTHNYFICVFQLCVCLLFQLYVCVYFYTCVCVYFSNVCMLTFSTVCVFTFSTVCLFTFSTVCFHFLICVCVCLLSQLCVCLHFQLFVCLLLQLNVHIPMHIMVVILWKTAHCKFPCSCGTVCSSAFTQVKLARQSRSSGVWRMGEWAERVIGGPERGVERGVEWRGSGQSCAGIAKEGVEVVHFGPWLIEAMRLIMEIK